MEVRRWFSIVLYAIGFCILCSGSVVEARQCCPSDLHLLPYTSVCSDNRTRLALKCSDGALLLDPVENVGDDFHLEENGSVIVFDGEWRTGDEFCLGKVRWNETWTSPHTVALVCFATTSETTESHSVSIFLRLLMLISTFFLLLTLYVYLVLPNLRDLQGKCVIAFICSLVSSYVTLLVIQTFPNSSKTTCVIQAALLYFFMTACFFWNNIITFSIWKAIRNVPFKISEKHWLIIYFCWGFGTPLLMVIISFILEHVPGGSHVRPHFAETKCWFKGKLESWNYFHGPVSVLLVLNIIMFIQSSWTLLRTYKGSPVSRIRSLKFKCLMYLKLFLIMGISWVFEVISYATNEYYVHAKYLWLLTDCINSAQGVIIFLILVVFRQKVRLGLLERKLFGIRWPQSWANEELQESSITIFGNEFELDKQKLKITEGNEKALDAD